MKKVKAVAEKSSNFAFLKKMITIGVIWMLSNVTHFITMWWNKSHTGSLTVEILSGLT